MEPVFPFDIALRHGQGQLTRALHQQVRSAILDGRMPSGACLPSTRRAARALGVSRNTVVTAYDLLIAEGYVEPRNRARPVVATFAARCDRPAPGAERSRRQRLNPTWRTPFTRFAPSGDPPQRSFRLGIPDHRHFPHEIWRRLHGRVLRAWSRAPFGYPPAEGIAELRAAIALHVGFARAVACAPGDVIVTSGAQQAFDLLARVLVRPGNNRVAVEEPGYPPLRAAFAGAGAELVPVPVDEEGIRVEAIPENVGVVCVTPSHQAPTGVALSLRRRTALLELAARCDAVIVEDDYDGEFCYGGRPLDALQTLDRDGRVFYVGTFSKCLFPALRKGFVVAPEWAREALVTVKHCTDAHADGVAQTVLAEFIREGHLARHVRRMTRIYGERRKVLLEGIRTELADWLEPIYSEAGLHLAARIRSPERAAEIFALARQHAPGSVASREYALGADHRPTLTFGFAVIDVEDIQPALMKFKAALTAGCR